MLTLYYTPGTVAVIVAIAMQEAGLAYDPVKVDFASAEQTKPEYLRINPKGRVPALVTDQGILTETGALLDYVAALAPQANLVPKDAFAAARMRETMCYLASTMHISHAHKMRGARWADTQSAHDDMAAKVTENMTTSAKLVETTILQGPFVLGDTLSLADPYLFVLCSLLPGDGVDLAAFPKISAFLDMMRGRESVQAVTQQGMLKGPKP